MHLLFAQGQRNVTTSTASVATEESTANARVTNAAYAEALRRAQLRLNREQSGPGAASLVRVRTANRLLSRSNSLPGPRDIGAPGEQLDCTASDSITQAPRDADSPKMLNAAYEFQGLRSLSDSGQGATIAQDPSRSEQHHQLNTDYEFQGRRLTQSDSSGAGRADTDYEFQAKLLSDSARGSSSGAPPGVQLDLDPQRTESETSRSASSQPKFEVDFKQGGAQDSSKSASASAAPQFEIDFRQKSSSAGKRPDTTEDTRDGNESETKEIELETGVTAEAEEESQEEDSDGNDVIAELEGESHKFPVPPPRILTQPMANVKKTQSLVFGHLSIMVPNVSEDAILLPLKSPALADLLENSPKYRAIALRCACEIIFTRRIIVKRVVKWCRYSVLLIRGPSDAAIKKFRQCLESANRAFHQAVQFDAGQPRPRLLASETLPDNLGLAVCADRLGPASAAWEKQIPLNMPQRKFGTPLYGKQASTIQPNNRAISPVLAYVYPKWGFQTSKPIPHTQLFEAAVDKAMELEKQQKVELRK